MYYHELIVFCITGWIEYESSHPFSTPSDNCTWTWFGTNVFWHDTRLIIFWNKNTIVKLLLYKKDSNVNVLNSRITLIIFNNINTTGIIFLM